MKISFLTNGFGEDRTGALIACELRRLAPQHPIIRWTQESDIALWGDIELGWRVRDKVTRAEHVKVRTLTLDGSETEIDAHGLLAVCIQHEMDHLQGKVFVDHLSQLKQTRIKTKLAKQARESA